MVGIAALAGLAFAYRRERRRIERRARDDAEWAALQERLPSMPVTVTSADGTRLHAEVFGPEGAPTVVLIHGWCCAVRFWHYQLRDLAGDFRIVAYDLRGHGRSARPATGDYSTGALAADLDAVLAACVPADRRVAAVGHSMGGMSLVAWAGEHPTEVSHRLAGVVLVDTGVGHLVDRSTVMPRVPALSGVRTLVGRLVLGAPVPVPGPFDPAAHGVIRFIALSPRARAAHVAFCAEMIGECPPPVRAASGLTLARLHLVDHLAGLAVPTVVLVGSDDRLTPPTQAEAIAAEVPGAELVVLPGSGHMAPVEAADEVTGHIRAMVERAPGA